MKVNFKKAMGILTMASPFLALFVLIAIDSNLSMAIDVYLMSIAVLAVVTITTFVLKFRISAQIPEFTVF